MDKVRFSIGDPHVWQGFHIKGDHGMVGALVFVTADTLRQITDHMMSEVYTSDFDKAHNAPEEDWATLAFGDTGTIMSPLDGMTPLYRLTLAEPTIVQRFNPQAGRRMEHIKAEGGSEYVPLGAWETEDTIDSFEPWSDVDDDFEPVLHGFVINRDDVRDGRSDAPLIETEYSRRKREEAENKEYLVEVAIPLLVRIPASNPEMAADIARDWFTEQGIDKLVEDGIEESVWYLGTTDPKATTVDEDN